MTSLLLGFFLVLSCGGELAGQGRPAQNLVPFSDLANEFVRNHGLPDIERNDEALKVLLDRGYVKIRLGVFQVWHPAVFLEEKRSAKAFQEIACSLLDIQDRWLEWIAGEDSAKVARKESKQLKKWIRSWKPARAVKKRERGSGGSDLVAILKAKEKITIALGSYARRMDLAGIMSPRKEGEDGILVLLAPTRKDFLGLGSFIGSLNAENKRWLWHDGLALWTSFNRGSIHVIALEHPASYPGRGDIAAGLDMNAKEETGRLQHVVQASMELLLSHYYGKTLPQDLSNGIAMCMVVGLFGENNVRAGGGSQGTQSGASSRFVRGGRSTGGKLPPTSAESRWRKTKGADHFIAVLRAARKEGAKDSAKRKGKKKDGTDRFRLKLNKGDDGCVVTGPFLTASTEGEPIPEEYRDEFMEFFRAYRCAFVHWLMSAAAAPEGKASPDELFRAFLRALAPPPSGKWPKSFDKTVEEVYGRALSASEPGEESLEQSFLAWLARAK